MLFDLFLIIDGIVYVLEPSNNELNLLKNEGIEVKSEGTVYKLKGSLQIIFADNLVAH